jgi:hypothetical protein
MVIKTLSLTVSAVATAIFAVAVMASLALEVAAVNEDGQALMALRETIDDTDGTLSSWDPDLVDPCTWIRIECNNNDNRVIDM